MSFIEEFQVTIKNDTVAGQAVQERIVKILEDLGYPPRDVFGVRLALEEALVNAIKHGNGMDPEKTVRIDCRINLQTVRIEIEDEGDGFEPGGAGADEGVVGLGDAGETVVELEPAELRAIAEEAIDGEDELVEAEGLL
ncbi:MAG: ATP-binding protein [Planctomycetes bacterium]|nr:ATP-binding protein [Planctomycetota bacterium]